MHRKRYNSQDNLLLRSNQNDEYNENYYNNYDNNLGFKYISGNNSINHNIDINYNKIMI